MSNSVYMVINHIQKPAAGVNMSKKGAAANPDNWETFENMYIVDKLTANVTTTASLILDLLTGKVIKNRFDVDDTVTFKEYVTRYQDDVTEALKVWARQNPNNLTQLRALAEAAEAAMGTGTTNDETYTD